MDVHQRESQVCILDDRGAVVMERRIRTERSRFAALLGERPRARVVIEASTESEGVAQSREPLGHEVIVADPHDAAMYARRRRRVKTDRRAARPLAEAGRVGAYRPAHRTAAAPREVRAVWAVREGLVRTRVRSRALLRALLRREGIAVPTGSAAPCLRRRERIALPAAPREIVAPLVALLAPLNGQSAAAEARIGALGARDPVAQRLTTAPGVGPVPAVAFVATLADVRRVASAGPVAGDRGVVPREQSAGERPHRGGLTKAGHSRRRWLLVQAAGGIGRDRSPASVPLRPWAQPIATRRGKRVAAGALARRRAGILDALWRDGGASAASRVGRRALSVIEAA